VSTCKDPADHDGCDGAGQEKKEGVCEREPIGSEGIQKDDRSVADNTGQRTGHNGAPKGTETNLE